MKTASDTTSTTELRLGVRPGLDEVRALAAEHNLVPVSHTFLEDCETPVSAFLKLRGAGPACHTGERTCFHRGELEPSAPHEVLPGLERTIAERAASAPEGSYTARLLADPPFVGEKVQEEAEEVARAAREEPDDRVAEEAADVLYHLAVLLRGRGLSLTDAEEVLRGRRR